MKYRLSVITDEDLTPFYPCPCYPLPSTYDYQTILVKSVGSVSNSVTLQTSVSTARNRVLLSRFISCNIYYFWSVYLPSVLLFPCFSNCSPNCSERTQNAYLRLFSVLSNQSDNQLDPVLFFQRLLSSAVIWTSLKASRSSLPFWAFVFPTWLWKPLFTPLCHLLGPFIPVTLYS